MPMAWENAKHLILQFSFQVMHHVDAYNILPDDIRNLDEAGFKIGHSTISIQYFNHLVLFHMTLLS